MLTFTSGGSRNGNIFSACDVQRDTRKGVRFNFVGKKNLRYIIQVNQGLINILLSLFPECEIQPIYIRLETPLVEKTSFLKKTKT